MKTVLAILIKTIRLTMPAILIAPFLLIYSQSGKVVQEINPKATQTPPPEVKSSTQSNFVFNGNADKYKIIFLKSFEGRRLTVGQEEAERGRHWRLKKFAEEINHAGAQGYRLFSVIRGWNPVAIVKLDEAQYQYDWFETTSFFRFTKGEFHEKQAEMARQGFYIVEHFFISRNCVSLDSVNVSGEQLCKYKDLFLTEKRKNIKKPVEQILVGAAPGWGAKPSVALEEQIDQKLAEGFYPVNVFSAFEILLERAKEKDELLSNKPEVQVVRTASGKGSLEEKVNELAKQGYRLAMTDYQIAVLYRNRETAAIPVSYVWLRTDRKNFSKELEKLQEKGAIYKTTYPDDKGIRNTLIFEQKLKPDAQRVEFKVLKLEFDYQENKAEQKVYVDFGLNSKEVVKQMNDLVREGFEVLDLFEADGISAILERRK